AAFKGGQVDAVGAFQPFADTALSREGSRAIATSLEFPGAIPDHLVLKSDLVKNRPEVAQGLVNTWFDTLKWIKDNKAAATEIMAKRASVSAEDYKKYDAGTTIFTRQQNLDAFTPGTTAEHLNHQAQSIVTLQRHVRQGDPPVSQSSGQKPRSTDRDPSTWVDEPAPAEEREDLVGWTTTRTEKTEEAADSETAATTVESEKAGEIDGAAGSTTVDGPAGPTGSDDTYLQIHWVFGGTTPPFTYDDLYDENNQKRIARKFSHLPL
ncbi:ABC transporter substrate-binding protein, partial [Kibdelosporangium lantanae]